MIKLFFCFDFPQNFKRQAFVITSKQLVHETRLFDTQNTTENTHIKFFLPVWKAENFSSLEQEENSEPCHMKEFIENYSRLRLDPMNLYRRIFFAIVFTFNEKVASNNAACNFFLLFFIWSGFIPPHRPLGSQNFIIGRSARLNVGVKDSATFN